jgi:pimeloyl-ACP methyl ester carboxylesterase
MRRMSSHPIPLILALASVVATATACRHPRPPEPVDRIVIVDDSQLYTPPDPLPPGRPGEIIWATGPRVLEGGGTEQKILYRSTTARGAASAVSAKLFVPADPAPDAPVISLAHGTSGVADCGAPSRDGESHEPELAYFSGLAGEGRPGNLFAQGAIVVATDYEGLGPPGVHPYVVGRSEGANVLDAVRAARRFTGTRGPSVTIGHSQGGGAALWAAQMAPGYAPDTHLVGAVAGAPAVELPAIARGLTAGPTAGADLGYLFLMAAGYEAAYPKVDLADYLTPAGREATAALAVTCDEEAMAVAAGRPVAEFVSADPAAVDPLARLLEENSPGNVPTPVPVFLYHGDADELIPAEASEQFLVRACRTGGFTIDRRTYPGDDHVSIIATVQADVRAFVAQRLSGAPARATPCP